MGTGLNNRMFDLSMVLKSGGKEDFVGIDKREIDKIIQYFQAQSILVKKIIEDKPNYKNDYYQFVSALFRLNFPGWRRQRPE